MTDATPATTPKAMKRTGFVLSGLVVAFMAMDVTMKLMQLAVVAETSAQLGWGSETGLQLGIILLVCTVVYAVPQTAILGAILLTGYLGGAVATHMRVGDPLLSHTLFGVYVGILTWAGLWCRDARLRALLPLRR